MDLAKDVTSAQSYPWSQTPWEWDKGYGTRAHRDAIEAYGVTPIHRRSFAPIARALQARQIDFIDHVSQ